MVDDVPMGISSDEAPQHIKLLMIVNDVSLRNLMPDELSKQFGFLNSKPSTAFSPVAVTPDEAGDAWDGRKLALPLISIVNGREIGRPSGAVDLNFDFADLIAHAARTRNLKAGCHRLWHRLKSRPGYEGCCLQELPDAREDRVRQNHDRSSALWNTVRIEMTDAGGGGAVWRHRTTSRSRGLTATKGD